MSETRNPHLPPVAAQMGQSERAAFLTRTYTHLIGALVAFTLIEVALFKSGLAERIFEVVAGTSWLLVLGAFLVVGWLASRTAHRAQSKGMQYLALLGYVVAEALIFVPLLYIATAYFPGVLESAALISLMGFAGLSGIVFYTRIDFSPVRGLIGWGMVVALLLIVGSVLFGFELGTWFSVAMIALAGGSILLSTSRVMNEYPVDRHVAASLELFAAVMLLFWYVLRLLMSLQRD